MDISATEDNAIKTLYSLLKQLRAKVTETSLREQLPLHPDFPSLFSLSQLLTTWKIDNVALHFNTCEKLLELPLPFIAHLKSHGGWYILVKDLNSDNITYLDSLKGRVKLKVTEFEEQWSGAILLAECDEQSGEVKYNLLRTQEKINQLLYPAILTLVLLFFTPILITILTYFTIQDYLLLTTKSFGLFTSVLLVEKMFGIENSLTNKLCRLSSKTNCENILNTNAAYLWNWLSWAEVGMVYFFVGLISVLLKVYWPGISPILHLVSIGSLPYILFSIYYQGIVAKNWCSMCLVVQAILLIEGLWALTQPLVLSNSWQPYMATAFALLVSVSIWLTLKTLIIGTIKSQKNYQKLLKFQRNPDLFHALIEKQPIMTPITEEMHPIYLGNENASYTITVVTNPYCGPCAHKHQELEELIAENSHVNMQIIFTCDGANGRNTQVAVHIIALHQKGLGQIALDSWYKQLNRSYNKFSSQFPIYRNQLDPERIANINQQWCIKNHIIATPTIFLNGYQLTDLYSASEAIKMASYLNLKHK